MMTRKDYRVVAGAIREAFSFTTDSDERLGIANAAEAVADALWRNSKLTPNGNRSFDPERFLREAGVR